MNDWSSDIELILENIRLNCILSSNYHKERYYFYKDQLKYFKLPLIILSSITSIASVGLSNYMKQEDISMTTCLLSLISAIIASVELYLGLQKSMEVSLSSSKDFLLIAYDVFKVLSLSVEHRSINGKVYLEDIYSQYSKLIESSELMKNKKIKDTLAPIPEPFKISGTISSSSPSSSIIQEV